LATLTAAKCADVDSLYSEQDQQNIRDAFSAVIGVDDEEDSVLDDIFGNNAKLTYEAFVDTVSMKAAWIFKAPVLRQKVWKNANVPIRHIE